MKRSFLARSVLLVLLGTAAACGGGSRTTSSFATRGEAGGVVPGWVPAAATELKLQSEEGSGAFWLRFRLPAAERAAVEAELLRIPDLQVATLTFRAPKGADWWFRGLVQVVPARASTVVAADVYSGAGRSVPLRTFVAFDRASDAVYAWSAGQ
ncbi:MAG: hypothetical protein IPN83_07955 [Holophagales bacterium]|nr:hypothetical protein [Holophagales bacterium]